MVKKYKSSTTGQSWFNLTTCDAANDSNVNLLYSQQKNNQILQDFDQSPATATCLEKTCVYIKATAPQGAKFISILEIKCALVITHSYMID